MANLQQEVSAANGIFLWHGACIGGGVRLAPDHNCSSVVIRRRYARSKRDAKPRRAMYQSLRHRCRCLRLNRIPSCFPTALMLVSAASARHPMPLSSRRRSPALPPVTDPTRIALKKAIEVTAEAPDENLPAARLAQCSDQEMAVRRLVFGRFAVSTRATAFMAGLGRAGRPSAPHARGRARETARSDPPDSSLARTASRNQARPRPHKAPAPDARAAS
jgi:hypothetical protein